MKNYISRLFAVFSYFLMGPIYTWKSRHTDFYEYRKLLSYKFSFNPLWAKENSYYGHATAIRRLGGTPWRSTIEHGVFFGDELRLIRGALTPLKRFFVGNTIFTLSERRREVVLQQLEEHGVRNVSVVAVGPYILGAPHFWDKKKLFLEKRKLGRVLLVIPLHTIEDTDVIMRDNDFWGEIEKKLNDFDTVLVCEYWADLAKGTYRIPAMEKLRIVCCGRREDPFFISRQKDLFWLSDMVVTNGMGTHIGYSVAMGKPCYLYDQEFKMESAKSAQMDDAGQIERRVQIFRQEGFYSAFSVLNKEITAEQIKLVKKWWGDWDSGCYQAKQSYVEKPVEKRELLVAE